MNYNEYINLLNSLKEVEKNKFYEKLYSFEFIKSNNILKIYFNGKVDEFEYNSSKFYKFLISLIKEILNGN